MEHELKTLPEYFRPAWDCEKPFEIRKNDRDFKLHDKVTLREHHPKTGYTGREICGIINYLTGYKQKKGYVVFSLDGAIRSMSIPAIQKLEVMHE